MPSNQSRIMVNRVLHVAVNRVHVAGGTAGAHVHDVWLQIVVQAEPATHWLT